MARSFASTTSRPRAASRCRFWLVGIFMALVFWGGLYLAYYSGGFHAESFNPRRGMAGSAVDWNDPATLGKRVFTQKLRPLPSSHGARRARRLSAARGQRMGGRARLARRQSPRRHSPARDAGARAGEGSDLQQHHARLEPSPGRRDRRRAHLHPAANGATPPPPFPRSSSSSAGRSPPPAPRHGRRASFKPSPAKRRPRRLRRRRVNFRSRTRPRASSAAFAPCHAARPLVDRCSVDGLQ